MHTPQQHADMEAAAPRVLSWLALTALALAGLAGVAAGVLWMKFGATVFFEMVAAGIAACF
ncbi:MAG: hypothetical protein EPO23_07880 [Xanthobacteraceae bacterium]|nr:MAG: hypothetical protein EPO23_07880 [Xanthobacteraceae bacterium]